MYKTETNISQNTYSYLEWCVLVFSVLFFLFYN